MASLLEQPGKREHLAISNLAPPKQALDL